jgi:aspartyl-tRNA(Asn)/glutamyl-tRNA(Gln) amidotransferase subunit A
MSGVADYPAWTAGQIAASVMRREVSAVEVTQAALARMAATEPIVHAFCTPLAEQALRDAAALDARIGRGEAVGCLAGVPVAVKDLILMRGVPSAFGSPLYRDFVPDEDDVVVERLRAADAIIVGKTNTSELGYAASGRNTLFPATRNPWNPALTPGGSSAGSAAAVAAGTAPIALGSDAGGSVRIPAAFCGLFGMKPSMGRVPLYPGCRDARFPGLSSWESLEHIGPITRGVADAGLLLSVIAGPDARDRHSIPTGDVDWIAAARGSVSRLRIGYSVDLGYAAVDPEVAQIFVAAVELFARAFECSAVPADPGWRDPMPAFAALEAMDTDLSGLRGLAARHGGAISPGLRALLDRRWTAEAFSDAIVARKRLCAAVARLLSRFDLFLTPTTAAPPFPVALDGPAEIDGRPVGPDDWACFTFPFNMTGQPASSVVAGWTAHGLPVGMQIVGGHLADALVLRASAAFERVSPWQDRRPTLPAS